MLLCYVILILQVLLDVLLHILIALLLFVRLGCGLLDRVFLRTIGRPSTYHFSYQSRCLACAHGMMKHTGRKRIARSTTRVRSMVAVI